MNQRRVRIDPAKSQVIEDLKAKGMDTQDADSIPTDISIDDLMGKGLRAIYGTMRAIMADVGTGHPSRETVMNLKDIMAMLHDLKKKEQELLNNLTDEQLEEILNERSSTQEPNIE